jgi:hypothetical protein
MPRLEKVNSVHEPGVTLWRVKSTRFLYGPYHPTRRAAVWGWILRNFGREHEIPGQKLYYLSVREEAKRDILNERIAEARNRAPVPNDKRRLPDVRPGQDRA